MLRRVIAASVLVMALAGATASMQQLPPGYVDPNPVLQAAARAIGTDNLKCVTVSVSSGSPTSVSTGRASRSPGSPAR